MGHRALVAYQRPDRLYDLRYSHWGGEDLSLATEISAATPLADGAVDAALLADSVARERILTAYLDPCIHEALYLVTPADDYAVDAYRVCWLEWGDGRDGGRGAVVPVDPDEDRRVRTWFRATKTALGDIVEMGALSRRAAQSYLEARVCEEGGTVYTHGEGVEDGSTYDPRPDRWLEGGADPQTTADSDPDTGTSGDENAGGGGGRDADGNGDEDEGRGRGDAASF